MSGLLPVSEPLLYIAPQLRHRGRQLVAPRRRLAQPERNAGRLAVGVLHPHGALLHPQYSPGEVAELEDVALEALDRKVLVHRADEGVVRLEDHPEIGVVGNGAAGGDRQHARSAPASDPAVDRVVMDQRAPPAPAGGEALGEHLDHVVELGPLQIAVGIRLPHQLEHLLHVPVFPRRLRHDLLGQHVQRLVADDQPVELSPPDRPEQRGALDQLVAGERKEPPLGRAVHRVPRAAHPLEEGGDPPRRAQLGDQIHVADVDAQLQRGRGHQRLELPGLEPLLGVEPGLLGETAVVRRHRILAEPLGQVARHPLRQPAGVHEHQRGLVGLDQLRQPVVDLVPHLARHDRLERGAGELEREVQGAAVALVDDAGSGTVGRAVAPGEGLPRSCLRCPRPLPTSHLPTSSIGSIVAERPIR